MGIEKENKIAVKGTTKLRYLGNYAKKRGVAPTNKFVRWLQPQM